MYRRCGTVSDVSKQKSKFRQSAKWKKFRNFMKKECHGNDFLTGKKLIKGFSLHHKDMRIENYEKLNPERFVCLNKMSHDTIHFCFKYYQTDKDFLNRLQIILEEMDRMNID